MTRFAKFYCLVAIVLSIDFIATCLTELSGIHLDALMLLFGLLYVAWLPTSLLASITFFASRKPQLGITAAAYVIYVIANYLATPDNLSKVTLNAATICGLAFFALYGMGNTWLLKQIGSASQSADASTASQ